MTELEGIVTAEQQLRCCSLGCVKVLKRGAPPGGGGEVLVRVPIARKLPPISLMEEGT